MSKTFTISESRTVTIKPFNTPNYVVAVDGREDGISLMSIPANILSDMCDEWRREVFKKARLTDPKEQTP